MYEGNSEDESRKILIDGRDAETRGKRDAPTREIEGTRGTRVRAASLGKGKKSRRRMDYRGASKDGTMEAKTETSLTGSRLPGRESTWPTGALELPGSSVSTCLPLPSILLSLFLSFSRFLLLFLPSCLLLSISSSSSFSFSFSSSPFPSYPFSRVCPPRRRPAAALLLLPLSLARTTPIRAESRFTQIRRERLLHGERRGGATLPNLFPR